MTTSEKGQFLPSCEWRELPVATLSDSGQEQVDAMVSTNWMADYCSIDAHPFFTVPLPDTPLSVPLGGSPQLEFTIEPLGVSGYAWRPDFASAGKSESNRVQVSLDDLRGSTRVDLAFEPAMSQRLDLSMLPVGDYTIEVFAGWEDGQAGWAFRVEIIEP